MNNHAILTAAPVIASVIAIAALWQPTQGLAQPAATAQPAPAAPVNPAAARIKPLVNGEAQSLASQLGPYKLTRIADDLAHPWGIAFLPGGDFLVTERLGDLRRVSAAGVVSAPIAGVPEVFVGGHGGLLDVVLSPTFAQDQSIYLSYTESTQGHDPVGAVVVRARLDGTRLQDVKVIYRQSPKLATPPYWQFGGRLAFDGKGHLFIGQGDNNVQTSSQDLDKTGGKIIRLNLDGSIPKDNPFVNRPGARPEIWSYGHRNVEGLGINPATGELWATEHGQRGGDELNIARPGRNYGWPLVTYGVNYDAQSLSETIGTTRKGLEDPIYHWARSPALSGFSFVTRNPKWKGNLLLGGLADRQLIRLELSQNKVVGEERLLTHLNQRIRAVNEGPDGNIYILTDAPKGWLLKLEPPRD